MADVSFGTRGMVFCVLTLVSDRGQIQLCAGVAQCTERLLKEAYSGYLEYVRSEILVGFPRVSSALVIFKLFVDEKSKTLTLVHYCTVLKELTSLMKTSC